MVYNNQPIEVLIEACKNSISQLNEPVWYSCEVDQKFSSELGIEDLKMYVICFDFDYPLALHTRFVKKN